MGPVSKVHRWVLKSEPAQHQKPRNGFSLPFHSFILIKVIVNDRHTWPNLLKKQHRRWPEHWRSSVPLCIFTAACKIDWVLIVFPRVLEGSARGIDQPLTKPLALRALHRLSLWCRQTEIKELKNERRKVKHATRKEEAVPDSGKKSRERKSRSCARRCVTGELYLKIKFLIKMGNSEPPAGSGQAIRR